MRSPPWRKQWIHTCLADMDIIILTLVGILGFYVGYLGGARHIVNFLYRK